MRRSVNVVFDSNRFILCAFLILTIACPAIWADDAKNSPAGKREGVSTSPSAQPDSSAAPKTASDSSAKPSAGSPPKTSAAAKATGEAAKPENTYAGLWPSRFKMAVSYRGRIENPSGRNYAQDSGDGYYLSRLRIEATFKLNKYVNLFAMAQDGRVFGYNDPGKRPAGMMDVFDLRQAYMDIHRELSMGALSLRIGRQYLNFGSKRLVGVADWSNSPAVFDAAKLNVKLSGVSVDVFASTRVSTIHSYTFNEPKKGENLYGAYLSFNKLVPNAQIEPYLFWRTQPLVTDELKSKGDSDLATAGFRFLGKLPHRFDYTSEFAFQRGTYASDSVSAWAASWGMGYTLSKSARKPRLLFEYNYATGDKLRGDGTRGTFDQLYAVNHSLYGIADQTGWRNANNYKIGFEVQATKRLKLQFDVNDFYLATLEDALYADNGSSVIRNTKAASSHIGWEPDLQVTYKLTKQINVGGGYGRLIPGAFLKQSTSGHPYNFPYLIWDFRY
jgi:hypothetical protein